MSNRKDLTIAIVGGVMFVVVWVVLEFLIASDPSPVFAILGGIAGGLAWFVGTLIFRKWRRESESSRN